MTNVQDQAAQSVTAAHVKLYRATGGLLGGFIAGMPVLLLMTTGRRTGDRRTSPLTYFRVDDRIFVIASYGGARHNPAWYLNLEADPNVEVQRWRSTIPMQARTISGADRDRVWSRVTLLAPIYRWYQRRTDREIPVVELVAVDEDGHLDQARDPVDFSVMTKSDLMDIAAQIELRGRSKMDKTTLLAALRAREADVADAARGL